MGCSCTKENKDKEEVFDPERYKYLERSFKNDKRMLGILIKVQAKIRGYCFRSALRGDTMKKARARNKMPTIDSESNYTAFVEFAKNQIVSH